MTQTKIERQIGILQRQGWTIVSPETVGAFPIRQDITILPADDIRKLRLGWVIKETIGIAVVNLNGISKLCFATGENDE